MKVIIMGCGRVGEQVARFMASDGHDVAVIDYDELALARLGPDFKGKKIKGVGFDHQVLMDAGIESADAFVATSSSDNANVVAARLARNIFRVPRVVARLYDPQRAEVYQRLGLVTISSTTWGAHRIQELLTHADFDPLMTFGRGEVALISIEAPVNWVGRTVNNITIPREAIVVSITRNDQAMIPILGTEFQSGDVFHLAVLASAMQRIEELLGLGEGG